ncbi:MAG: phytanoyl-CoA dioxygenase family protein [Roseiflexaceae bacterium]|nr:phytanoyl-CoA dioxygenase family protein [Roseiflexaceae bacterium]
MSEITTTEIAPTIQLTQHQIDCYHRDGYLALDAITTQAEVAWLREIYDRLFAQRAGRDVGDQFDLAGTDEEGQEATLPQILGPSKYAPELKQGLFRANALAVARQLLGPEAQAHGEHAILKPARIGAETPWHQDEAYWNPMLEYNSMSIWIPLQDVNLHNGCMQFVPGSNHQEIVPHHPINNDPRIHGLVADQAHTEGAVACPLPAGGATIHTNRTLHYTGPNHSDQPRRAYILIFGTQAKRRTEPRSFYWNENKTTARDQRAEEARRNEEQQPM